MNLYAYAGNNPVAYSDPWGLCPERKDFDCPDEVASFRVGATVGLKYKVKTGVLGGEVAVGATATGGPNHEVDPNSGQASNGVTGGAEIGATIELTAFGEGISKHWGPRVGRDADMVQGMEETPVQGDGTIEISGTIPLVWAGPVPVGGVQLEASVNVPAAYRRIRDGLLSLFGK